MKNILKDMEIKEDMHGINTKTFSKRYFDAPSISNVLEIISFPNSDNIEIIILEKQDDKWTENTYILFDSYDKAEAFILKRKVNELWKKHKEEKPEPKTPDIPYVPCPCPAPYIPQPFPNEPFPTPFIPEKPYWTLQYTTTGKKED